MKERNLCRNPDEVPSFPIMIKVWAGNGLSGLFDVLYIKQSLPSLLRTDFPKNTQIILVDDKIPNKKIKRYIRALANKYSFIEIWENPKRLGPNKGQEYNVPKLVKKFPEALFYVFCDDDIIYHPLWLKRLIKVYFEAYEMSIKGIFTALNVPFRPHYQEVKLPTSTVLLKKRQAAFNWLLPKDIYQLVGPFKDTGVAYDTDYCDRTEKLNLPVICLKPSYVQNIGYFGAYQNSNIYTAKDFVGDYNYQLKFLDLIGQLRYLLERVF